MFKKRFSMMTVLVACLCAIVVTLGAIFTVWSALPVMLWEV